MKPVKNQWRSAVRIWVALAWRSLAAIFVLRVVLGVAVHIAGWGLALSGPATANTAAATGLLIWLAVPVFVLKRMLDKGFGRYRLALRNRPVRRRAEPAGEAAAGCDPEDGYIALEATQ